MNTTTASALPPGSIPLASDHVLQTYKMLADHGELTSQVAAFPQVLAKNPVAELAHVQKTREAYKNVPNLHVTGIKIFADGVAEFPSQTAHFTKPYKNSGLYGDLLFDPKNFAELCVAADKQGLIIHVHAIGDGAVKAALDGIAAARAANPASKLPHTLTHEQFVRPEDFPRFRQLGVISALQLFWADAGNDTIEILKPYLDPEIYKWQYPARSILDNGGIISGASDWPVSTANVFRAIYQAETRKGNGRRSGSFPGHAPRSDVLRLYPQFGKGHESGFHRHNCSRQARGSGVARPRRAYDLAGRNARHKGRLDHGRRQNRLSPKVIAGRFPAP